MLGVLNDLFDGASRIESNGGISVFVDWYDMVMSGLRFFAEEVWDDVIYRSRVIWETRLGSAACLEFSGLGDL